MEETAIFFCSSSNHNQNYGTIEPKKNLFLYELFAKPVGAMRTKTNKMTAAVILTSHTIGLGVIRSLGKMGVPIMVFYYEPSDFGYLSKYVYKKIRAPHPEKFEQQFIELLVSHAPRTERLLLIPVDDATVLTVSKHKERLENYYQVACTEYKIASKFLNKEHTYKLAEKIGVPIPKTCFPENFAELEQCAQSVEYPCLVKPNQSQPFVEIFKEKMFIVNNQEQLIAAFKKAAQASFSVMIQELIPGDDALCYNYNSYFWNGAPLVEFTAEKVRLSNSGFGVPTVVQSCPNQNKLRESARTFLNALGYYGYSCTEFKKDIRDGVYKLMEVNGRFNRSGLLSLKCGLNFPWILYNHLVNGVLPDADNKYQAKIFWIDEFKDMSVIVNFLLKNHFSLIRFFQPYLRKKIFAVFDLSDPLPFIKRVFDMFVKLYQKIFPHIPEQRTKLINGLIK